MISVLRTTWPLLLGMLLLMVGNGMQGTLLGIRGGIEGIATFQMSIVMASYYGGFLLGSLMVPDLIKNVGHVRVFAALGSLISAVLVLFAVEPHWITWSGLRFVIGFCFCGVYITAESWLNAGSTNENRGQSLSAYMIVQLLGIVFAQALLNVGDPGGGSCCSSSRRCWCCWPSRRCCCRRNPRRSSRPSSGCRSSGCIRRRPWVASACS